MAVFATTRHPRDLLGFSVVNSEGDSGVEEDFAENSDCDIPRRFLRALASTGEGMR